MVAQIWDDTLLFPVAERFISINGEGPQSGRLAAFIRFRGCTLACSYCDTTWANHDDAPAEMMGLNDISSFVDSQPVSCVTLTGGEPLLQDGIDVLVDMLLTTPDRFVEIETNGAMPLARLADLRRQLPKQEQERLTFTMDCKLPSSGMFDLMDWKNYDLLEPHDTVKFVIGEREDFPTVSHVIDRYDLQERCHVFLSPVFGKMDPALIVDYMRESGLDQIRLQLQLHKLIWPKQSKGV